MKITIQHKGTIVQIEEHADLKRKSGIEYESAKIASIIHEAGKMISNLQKIGS